MAVGNPITDLSGPGNYVPVTRTLTINGVTFDLNANRSWTVGAGSVTSVAMSVPTGFQISGSPITSSGTLAVSFASGYSLPTTAKQSEWDIAYSNRITLLTTTGNSGASTLIGNTLNVPEYTLAGLGGLSNPFTTGVGQLIYSNSAGAPLRLAPNTTTTKMYLTMTGDGTNGAAPIWEAITGFVGGSGTTNYIPRFTASGTIGNSTMIQTSGFILFGASAGAVGTTQLTTASPSSPISGRLLFGTDNTGWQFRIAKNQAGTITDLFSIQDNGNVGINQLLPTEKLDVVGSCKISANLLVNTNTLFVDATNNRVGILNGSPSYAVDVTGQARISDALAIGTTPDTNLPFQILKNINSTVGIRFQNTSTSSLAFSAIQFGSDVTGGTAFCNFVYASSGITESGVFKPNGTALINTGSGGLNFLSVSQPIRFFTSSGTGTRRAEITNDGDFTHFNGTNPTASTTDAYRQYSADVVAGNAAPHFRTENGAVVKIYQETTAVGNSIISLGGGSAVLDDTTFDGYTLRQVVKALRNLGILQ